jgi:hypothetical protein
MGYDQPAVRAKFSPRDNPLWLGKLFLIYPTAAETVQFEDGPARIVTADVGIVDLIDPETGRPTVLLGASIGGKALVPQLEPSIAKGTAAAGRLVKLPAQGQKDGAYKLDNFTPADAPQLDAFDAQDWRGKHQQPAQAPPTVPGQQMYVPAAVPAGVLATPVGQTASPGAWYATDPTLFVKLNNAGVQNVLALDYQTAQAIGASLPG